MKQPTVILLVEEELTLRKLLFELLQAAGYTVLAASSAGDAIRALWEQRGQIGLLLTELDLGPGMSGIELAEYLRGLHSGLKVLVMSGSTEEEHGPDGRAAFIRKPFAGEDLVRKIAAVLTREDELFRRDCGWIQRMLARRYPQVHVECEEEFRGHYLVKVRLAPELPGKVVRFSTREYLDGRWEYKISSAVAGLDSP